MPLVNYRASAEAILHEIHEVTALGAQRPSTRRGGRRASAKQLREGLQWETASQDPFSPLTTFQVHRSSDSSRDPRALFDEATDGGPQTTEEEWLPAVRRP
jgi:hypothetical protein